MNGTPHDPYLALGTVFLSSRFWQVSNFGCPFHPWALLHGPPVVSLSHRRVQKSPPASFMTILLRDCALLPANLLPYTWVRTSFSTSLCESAALVKTRTKQSWPHAVLSLSLWVNKHTVLRAVQVYPFCLQSWDCGVIFRYLASYI
jgi:hypothetical protein